MWSQHRTPASTGHPRRGAYARLTRGHRRRRVYSPFLKIFQASPGESADNTALRPCAVAGCDVTSRRRRGLVRESKDKIITDVVGTQIFSFPFLISCTRSKMASCGWHAKVFFTFSTELVFLRSHRESRRNVSWKCFRYTTPEYTPGPGSAAVPHRRRSFRSQQYGSVSSPHRATIGRILVMLLVVMPLDPTDSSAALITDTMRHKALRDLCCKLC